MPPANQSTRSEGQRPKLALALQGSFGHMVYAAGILEAFRLHNLNNRQPIDFQVASGCVEMMLPLWLYFGHDTRHHSLRDALARYFSGVPAGLKLTPTWLDPASWQSFAQGIGDSGWRAWQALHDPETSLEQRQRALRRWAMSYGGLPGQVVFNKLFEQLKSDALQELMDQATIPLFSNAMNADDLSEIYLASGPHHQPPCGTTRCGTARHTWTMTPALYFASGARAPTLAPIEFEHEGTTHRWMEGAMRCNPPLNPLVDEGAEHIVLLRFFPKTNRERISNDLALKERFDDAIFTVPLDRELDNIDLVNRVVRSVAQNAGSKQAAAAIMADIFPSSSPKRVVQVTDVAQASPSYAQFIREELDFLSHFEATFRWEGMFDRGQAIGEALIRECQLAATPSSAASSREAGSVHHRPVLA